MNPNGLLMDSSNDTRMNPNAFMTEGTQWMNPNDGYGNGTPTSGGYDPYDMSDASRRNRGNYRCSKCGEPKKGHVCAYQPMNFKCNRCGNPKKSCTCGAPDTFNISCQCEMDEDMTVRVLNLKTQGVTDFHQSVVHLVGNSSTSNPLSENGSTPMTM